MNKVRCLLTVLCMLFLVQGVYAQSQESDAAENVINLIRMDKFEIILPQAMRDNNVDMWIYVVREDDPLRIDLGVDDGICVLTDRGGRRIERAVLGGKGDKNVYDIFGSERDLPEFVTERDPKRIALNYSEQGSGFNTITQKDRDKVLKALGDKYAKRVVPGDFVAVDFLSGKVMSEVVLFTKLGLECEKIIEGELDKIVPGETALKDLSGNVFVRDPDGNEENNTDYVIQRGDLIGLLHSAELMYFNMHIGGIAYVLRDGETDLPLEVKKIWEHALITREIFRKNIKAGPTGRETLELLIRKLEEAGYVYIDDDEYDRNADPEKTQVHIDFHTMGRSVSYEDAPRISPLGPEWTHDLKIPLYHTFTFEYMIHMPVPEWGRGKHLYVCLHDGVVVTERGVEFPYSPLDKIRAIR